MDIDDTSEQQTDPIGDSTLESEIDALSKIIEDSKEDLLEPVADNVIVSAIESGSDNVFSLTESAKPEIKNESQSDATKSTDSKEESESSSFSGQQSDAHNDPFSVETKVGAEESNTEQIQPSLSENVLQRKGESDVDNMIITPTAMEIEGGKSLIIEEKSLETKVSEFDSDVIKETVESREQLFETSEKQETLVADKIIEPEVCQYEAMDTSKIPQSADVELNDLPEFTKDKTEVDKNKIPDIIDEAREENISDIVQPINEAETLETNKISDFTDELGCNEEPICADNIKQSTQDETQEVVTEIERSLVDIPVKFLDEKREVETDETLKSIKKNTESKSDEIIQLTTGLNETENIISQLEISVDTTLQVNEMNSVVLEKGGLRNEKLENVEIEKTEVSVSRISEGAQEISSLENPISAVDVSENDVKIDEVYQTPVEVQEHQDIADEENKINEDNEVNLSKEHLGEEGKCDITLICKDEDKLVEQQKFDSSDKLHQSETKNSELNKEQKADYLETVTQIETECSNVEKNNEEQQSSGKISQAEIEDTDIKENKEEHKDSEEVVPQIISLDSDANQDKKEEYQADQEVSQSENKESNIKKGTEKEAELEKVFQTDIKEFNDNNLERPIDLLERVQTTTDESGVNKDKEQVSNLQEMFVSKIESDDSKNNKQVDEVQETPETEIEDIKDQKKQEVEFPEKVSQITIEDTERKEEQQDDVFVKVSQIEIEDTESKDEQKMNELKEVYQILVKEKEKEEQTIDNPEEALQTIIEDTESKKEPKVNDLEGVFQSGDNFMDVCKTEIDNLEIKENEKIKKSNMEIPSEKEQDDTGSYVEDQPLQKEDDEVEEDDGTNELVTQNKNKEDQLDETVAKDDNISIQKCHQIQADVVCQEKEESKTWGTVFQNDDHAKLEESDLNKKIDVSDNQDICESEDIVFASEIMESDIKLPISKNEEDNVEEIATNLEFESQEVMFEKLQKDIVENIFKSVNVAPDLSEILEADEEVKEQFSLVHENENEEIVLENFDNLRRDESENIISTDIGISNLNQGLVNDQASYEHMPDETEETEIQMAEDLEDNATKRDLEITEEMQLEKTEVLTSKIENADVCTETAVDTFKDSKIVDSELDFAVKFLQESEEKTVEADSTVLPKECLTMSESTDLFAAVENSNLCEDSPDLTAELQETTTNSIAISEAEIISEAAKLEREKKEKMSEQVIQENEASSTIAEEISEYPAMDGLLIVARPNVSPATAVTETPKEMPEVVESSFKSSENIPQISVLEERLKEPPQIEIPNVSCDIPSFPPKSNLLMPRDAKTSGSSQRSLDSPSGKKEESDNVGSPRIILKIAKSALADCAEPRSPKSPKIRSATNSPNPDENSSQKLGKIKLKLSKSGHPSIISNENIEDNTQTQWHADSSTSSLSPLGVKIKLSKSGDASVVQTEKQHDTLEDKEKHKTDEGKKVDTPSPIGMKIKLSKSGDASVIYSDVKDDDHRRNESPIGMKIKFTKSGDAEIIQPETSKIREKYEKLDEQPKRTESPIGMKIKLSKFGDPTIVQSEELKENLKTKDRQDDTPKRTESPIGVKIKLSKTGDASIVEEIGTKDIIEIEPTKRIESPIGVKIKLSKSGDASIVHPDKQEHSESESKAKVDLRDLPKRNESSIGMKIKLSKSGDASIISQDVSEESKEFQMKERHEEPVKLKLKTMTPDREITKRERTEGRERRHKSKEPEGSLEMKIKVSKSGHAKIVTSESYNEEKKFAEGAQRLYQNIPKVTIESLQMQKYDIVSKRKDLTISPVEPKKSKLEVKLPKILPEITIQSVMSKNVIENPSNVCVKDSMQDVRISQVRSLADLQSGIIPSETTITDRLKANLGKQMASPSESDCEIIEHQPELVLVNENSNSSQDVMIIEEVPAIKPVEIKVPKKRGRPRRSQVQVAPAPMLPRDPLALDDVQQSLQISQTCLEQRENERPRRTCRNQKSYAPPKRGRGGRGGGRGKRKIDAEVATPYKRVRVDQDLTIIEERTTSLITLDESPEKKTDVEPTITPSQPETTEVVKKIRITKKARMAAAKAARALHRKALQEAKALKLKEAESLAGKDDGNKETVTQQSQNWLAPLSKKTPQDKDSAITVQVIDEETRMSAESGSRSQTPARNLAVHVPENILNEESQGSVLSTATTESEKVKVKNRRMEINFDPDEGPFTVDKIAEYEWPLDRKGETFMIQEQISQYLGVKSFKRKYPDLKRRMVDMEERNYLRENGLVSEAMCDMGMGLTAIYSSEVLDIMCSDFPEQYEEYRKHMREKQAKEMSKKQKELSAAANAERTRIDLAEMAVQSAVSWNAKLNKSRKDSRKCCLDLQTFTIHVPQKKPIKLDPDRQISYYPVALIPGQYTDYYREYTPAELRYYPINTVLYGPTKPNERKFDSQSDGSQSDSESDSSSDDSSSSSGEETQDTEESQSTMEEPEVEVSAVKEETKHIKCKMCLKHLNKFNKSEILIQCGTCNGHVHPSCIDLTLDMVPHIQAYAWQCTDCKTCVQCHDLADEDKMLFCDMCDRGYHIYCVGLKKVPQGRWHCRECAVCTNCGTKDPAGVNADKNTVAQWHHEYKKGEKNIRVYVSTLCVPCSKMSVDQAGTSRLEKLSV